mmetsp:Transcript_7900/g.16430  ORF Transcript_7900/g.16430 Transcript_7900/m.16430 type:complete len:233 (+) Transcript_7900:245-943(+)
MTQLDIIKLYTQIPQIFPPLNQTQLCQFRLQLGTHQNTLIFPQITVLDLSHISRNLFQRLTAIHCKIDFVNVKCVNHRFQRQQPHGPDALFFLVRKPHGSGRQPLLQPLSHFHQHLPLHPRTRSTPPQPPLDMRQIRQHQLQIHHFGIFHLVHFPMNVNHIPISMTSHDVNDDVAFSHRGQEAVAESFSAGGSADQAGDVYEGYRAGMSAGCLGEGGQSGQEGVVVIGFVVG